MNKAIAKALGVIAKRLVAFQTTYANKTLEARTALIAAAALVYEVDNYSGAFSGDDGKALTGKALINARGAWYKERGLEPWFVNLARSLSAAVTLMGSAWVAKQSNETIKRLAPEVNAKHKSGKAKGKPLSAAKRKAAVLARLRDAAVIAEERGADTPSGDDISTSRNAGRETKGKSLAWIAKRGLEVDATNTGSITLTEWEAFVTMVTNGSAVLAAKLTADKATDKATDKAQTA